MHTMIASLTLLVFTLAANAQVSGPTAFTPGDVWVVVNKNMTASVALGEYYCQKRQVPMDHIVRLDLPESEEMTRADYETRLLAPLKSQLKALEQKDFILLTTYGVPIRVGYASPNPEDEAKLEVVKKELKRIHDELLESTESMKKLEQAGDASKAKLYQSTINMLNQTKSRLEQQEMVLGQKESNAAVDSELAMLWYPKYPLTRWQTNFRFFTIPEAARKRVPKIVMTCRLDGPNAGVAKRLIDDAIKAEAAGGPEGFAYVDARGMAWQKAGDPVASTYGGYDESLRELAGIFKKAGFRTTLDNNEAVFPFGACPRTALYCGWYSLQNYIPSFELMTGSIAWHIASLEAVSLREPGSRRWVPNLLQDGACVTIGAVWEPYLIGFPKPATFFGFLLAGHTVVESYWLSNHFTSWQVMIIGDPLYRPFGKKPKMESKEVKISPEGSVFPNRAQGNTK